MKDILKAVIRPTEFLGMVRFKYSREYKIPYEDLKEPDANLADRDYCYAVLNKVSRSFALVIRQLPEELRDAVCVFYLVLRGLDTVEDDMEVPEAEKENLLRNFHHISQDTNWKVSHIGDSEAYRSLLENYDKVTRFLKGQKKGYQAVILEICERMGNGMADFATKEVETIEDFDLYCHYVAGLVGHGLSGLFSASGLESAHLQSEYTISNSMGLFLQKTNIIRDYHEDINATRQFWPRAVWSEYTTNLAFFQNVPDNPSSINCLDDLVADALKHVSDCLKYMSLLKNPNVFKFCAIPQVMAIATLALVFDNPEVYKRNVKIRKGTTAKLFVDTNNMDDVLFFFQKFLNEIESKCTRAGVDYSKVKKQLSEIKVFLEQQHFGKKSKAVLVKEPVLN